MMMMKWIVASMVLTMLPYWILTASASPGNGEAKADAQVFVVAEVGVSGERHGVAAGCCAGDCCPGCCSKKKSNCRLAMLSAGDLGADNVRHVRRGCKVVAGEADAKDRGWLGVSVGDVPDAVAAHVNTEGRGVIILNVVKESPADRAGLEAHDIILSIAGEGTDGDCGHMAKLIGAHKPGERIDVKVLRGGQEKSFSIELGSRIDMGDFNWKFDWRSSGGPLAEVEEEIKTRGKLLHRGPGGNWVFKDLGDLELLKDLPDSIRMLIPKSGSCSIQVSVDDGQKTVKTHVERDGSVLVVEQEDDGEITVRRTDKDENQTTATYADEDELRKADQEAYEAFRNADKAIVMKLDVDGLEDLDDLDFDFDVDLSEWKEHLKQWQTNLEEALGEAGEAHRQAMEKLEEVMEQWKSGDSAGLSSPLPFMFHGEDETPGKFFGSGIHRFAKPRHTFELREDGKIEVRIRKGDSELVQLFADEDDLAERDSKLHAQYQSLLAAEE